MATTLIIESFHAEIGATEPWPDNASFYQPYDDDQILLPDFANCLSVKTFLNMCGLNYTVERRTNAEEMSPSGNVPFIHVGPFLISELDPIIAFVNTKGFVLSKELEDSLRSEMRAYMSLVNNVLGNAELYLSWCQDDVANQVTKKRYGSIYPWPLSRILPWKKQTEVKKRLKCLGWMEKTMDGVCEEVLTCCQALSERLDGHNYFFGDDPTELDALVFGHLFTMLTTSLPVGRFADIIKQFENLTDFCSRIDLKYFEMNETEDM